MSKKIYTKESMKIRFRKDKSAIAYKRKIENLKFASLISEAQMQIASER